MARDHRVEVYIDPITYLALRARSKESDLSISQHVRKLIRSDLEQFSDSQDDIAMDGGGGTSGEEQQQV